MLGLETGIGGGSLSVADGRRVIATVGGAGNVSRSEDLLSLLEKVLQKNALERSEIGQIVVSVEPGSLTGLRIGLATAKGMGAALSIPIMKLPVLRAMANGKSGRILSAISAKENLVYWQEFFQDETSGISAVSEIVKGRTEDLAAQLKILIRETDNLQIVLDEPTAHKLQPETHLGESLKEKNLTVVKSLPAEMLVRAILGGREMQLRSAWEK